MLNLCAIENILSRVILDQQFRAELIAEPAKILQRYNLGSLEKGVLKGWIVRLEPQLAFSPFQLATLDDGILSPGWV